jgi:hypothetical protein
MIHAIKRDKQCSRGSAAQMPTKVKKGKWNFQGFSDEDK